MQDVAYFMNKKLVLEYKSEQINLNLLPDGHQIQ